MSFEGASCCPSPPLPPPPFSPRMLECNSAALQLAAIVCRGTDAVTSASIAVLKTIECSDSGPSTAGTVTMMETAS